MFQICSNWIIRLIFHSSRFSFHAFGHHWDKNIFPHVLFFDDFIMCYLSISPLKKKIIKFPPLNIYILGARSITISVAAAEKNSPKPQMILEWIDQWMINLKIIIFIFINQISSCSKENRAATHHVWYIGTYIRLFTNL